MNESAATPDGSADDGVQVSLAVPAPVASDARLANLDFIRGIAVLGILAANIAFFGQPMMATMWPESFLSGSGDPDYWLWIAQYVLIDGKMRGLFTILFGVGLVLFIEKAWDRGEGRWLLARRLFWLLLFGLIHFLLIWRGDILTLYALAGAIALLCLRIEGRNLLVMGLLGYIIGGLVYVAINAMPTLVIDTDLGASPAMADAVAGIEEAQDEMLADDAVYAEILTQGNYFDFVQRTFSEHALDPFTDSPMMILFETLPLILIGMGLYRVGLFNAGLNRRKQLIWGWAGIIAGSAVTLLIALAVVRNGITFWEAIAAFTSYAHFPKLPVIIGLAAVLAIYGQHARGWLAERLSAAGRAAFTNYLGTSVLMMLVFHPWAGGLWGELSRPELYFVVLFGWAVMLAWSKPWLARYRYGPLEWLWRCLTYGRLFPLRR